MNKSSLWARIYSAIEAGDVPLALAVELSDETAMATAWAALWAANYRTLLEVTAELPHRAEVASLNTAILVQKTQKCGPGLRRVTDLLRRYQDPENEEYAYDDRVSFDDVRVALIAEPDHSRWAWEALAQTLDLVGFRRGEPSIDPFEYKGENGSRRVRNIIDHVARQAGVPWRDLVDVMRDFGPPTAAEVIDAVESGWGAAL